MVLHALAGRVRVKLSDVKGNPGRVRAIEARIGELPGVRHVSASPVTGNALIQYDVGVTDRDAILGTLSAWGHLWNGPPPRPAVVAELPMTLLRAAAELALQRALTALLVV